MDDRNLMENMLMLEKGACDLFMHGTIEASTDNVHRTFSDSLNTSLCLQEQLYSKGTAIFQDAGKGLVSLRASRAKQAEFGQDEIQCKRLTLFIQSRRCFSAGFVLPKSLFFRREKSEQYIIVSKRIVFKTHGFVKSTKNRRITHNKLTNLMHFANLLVILHKKYIVKQCRITNR